MSHLLIIPGRLPGLNDIVKADRTNARVGARLKRETETAIGWAIKAARLPAIEGRVDLVCTWHEPTARRDPDNITAGLKYILDALTDTAVLAGDGYRHIGSITHHFVIDRENPRVEVLLTPERKEPLQHPRAWSKEAG